MSTTDDRLTIANTIIAQLGGRRFTVMTGAKDFCATETGLSFRLPGAGGYCKNGINRVRIALTGRDDYDVFFHRVRGAKLTTIAMHSGIYAEQLRDVFTAATGLQTSLGTLGGQ